MSTLPERFASLPESIQSRLFRVLDVSIGMSQDEKEACRRELVAAAHVVVVGLGQEGKPTADLLKAVENFLWWTELEAAGHDDETEV